MLFLPLLIFLAETSVVTLDTVRTIFVARGLKLFAPLLGIVVVSIWLFAIGQIMQNLNQPLCYIGYAAGYTLGNYLGVLIEEKLALGSQIVRVITHRDATELIEGLRKANYGVTSVTAQGATGEVRVILTIVQRKRLQHILDLVHHFDSHAFYAVEDVRSTTAGVFPRDGLGRWAVMPGFARVRSTPSSMDLSGSRPRDRDGSATAA
jgi:uncharacterized protein YebE (UPF0316 family)